MAKVFHITPRSTGISVLIAFQVALALLFIGLVFYGAPAVPMILALVVILGLLGMLGWFLSSSRRTIFTLSEDGLVVSRTLYGRRVPASTIRVEDVRVIDLTQEKEYRGKWRTNGLGLSDYSLGWFILRNKENALMFVTDRHNVVYIPTRSGFSVLLSTPSPEAFLSSTEAAS